MVQRETPKRKESGEGQEKSGGSAFAGRNDRRGGVAGLHLPMLLITQLERHQTSNTTTHLIEGKFDAQGTNQSTLQYRKEGASHHCTPCTKVR